MKQLNEWIYESTEGRSLATWPLLASELKKISQGTTGGVEVESITRQVKTGGEGQVQPPQKTHPQPIVVHLKFVVK